MKSYRNPWLVVLAAALFFFYEFIQMNMISSLAPQLLQTFRINATMLGNLSATYFYSTILFLLPAGQILDRFSTRKVILTALLICIIGTLLFAYATHYWEAAISRFFTGIGSAFCFLSCIRLASRWFSSERMALISGLVVTMAMLGGTMAQAPLTALIQWVGNWRTAIAIDGLVGLIFWVIIFIVVRDYPAENANFQTQDQQQLRAFGYWNAMKKSYGNFRNWLCGLYTCFVNLPIFLIGGGGFGSLYLQQVKHLSTMQASYPPTLLFIGTMIGSPLAGWFSDKMRRRVIPMQIGVLLSIFIVLAIMFLDVSLQVYAILFLLLGLISSTQIISYPSVAESNPKLLTATSVSVVSFTTLSGGAIFPPLFGRIMDGTGDFTIVNNTHIYGAAAYHTAMYMMPLTMIIAFLLTFAIRESFGQVTQ